MSLLQPVKISLLLSIWLLQNQFKNRLDKFLGKNSGTVIPSCNYNKILFSSIKYNKKIGTSIDVQHLSVLYTWYTGIWVKMLNNTCFDKPYLFILCLFIYIQNTKLVGNLWNKLWCWWSALLFHSFLINLHFSFRRWRWSTCVCANASFSAEFRFLRLRGFWYISRYFCLFSAFSIVSRVAVPINHNMNYYIHICLWDLWIIPGSSCTF